LSDRGHFTIMQSLNDIQKYLVVNTL